MRKLSRIDSVIDKAVMLVSFPKEAYVEVRKSLGKYSAEKIVSSFKLPIFPKSVMDGYAIVAEDTLPSSPSSPVRLKIVDGIIRPGERHNISIRSGEAAIIETGGFLPEGADAVIPIEDTVREGGEILVFRRVSRWENVSIPGEEYDKDIVIVDKGWRIEPIHLAAFVLEGLDKVRVYRTDVSILNVGDELLKKGSVKPFTQELVYGWFTKLGFSVKQVEFERDDPEAIKRWLEQSDSYITVVMGGTSMGKHDYTVKAIKEISPDYFNHGFALQPGKTACLAVKDGRIYMAISGLPVAALSSLELILRPLLEKKGFRLPGYTVVKARLTRRLTVKMGMAGFARVRVFRENEEFFAEPLMVGGSGALGSLLKGNGFVVVPEDVEGYDIGDVVDVYLYGNVV
ncbi:MAG: hypothetical protein DRJ35_03590 [Thermoprotei archaeon]|nr:MAG: hypothetical protein DRJ35_03590 [Thermoprotei archaeon]